MWILFTRYGNEHVQFIGNKKWKSFNGRNWKFIWREYMSLHWISTNIGCIQISSVRCWWKIGSGLYGKYINFHDIKFKTMSQQQIISRTSKICLKCVQKLDRRAPVFVKNQKELCVLISTMKNIGIRSLLSRKSLIFSKNLVMLRTCWSQGILLTVKE